jgi:hypothetical protein
VRICRLARIEKNTSVRGCCCMICGLRMYLWVRWREHALDERAWWPSLSMRSMAASSARFMVCVDGVDMTRTLRTELEDGCVVAATRGKSLLSWTRLRRQRWSSHMQSHKAMGGMGSVCGRGGGGRYWKCVRRRGGVC